MGLLGGYYDDPDTGEFPLAKFDSISDYWREESAVVDMRGLSKEVPDACPDCGPNTEDFKGPSMSAIVDTIAEAKTRRGSSAMNLFRVLASGRKKFQEEQASAVLAWLLNPSSGHGLGNHFLCKFVESINIVGADLAAMARLCDSHSADGARGHTLGCCLEYWVKTACIDVVLLAGKYVIAVENKINADSVTAGQLNTAYGGLRREHSSKDEVAGMIYLVPYLKDDGDLLDVRLQREFDSLVVAPGDFKRLVTWQRNDLGYPSVAAMISDILADECAGLSDPIPEYTRHTLKALSAFIAADFKGYERDVCPSGSKSKPKVLNLRDLKLLATGYVGLQGGLAGLLQIPSQELHKRQFQYTTMDMQGVASWLPLDRFLELTEWLLGGRPPAAAWDVSLPAQTIKWVIAKCPGQSIYVGIRGGKKALDAMDLATINTKKWRMISASSPPTSEWVDGQEFTRIMNTK